MKLKIKQMRGYELCADCGGSIREDSTWLGEDENGIGHYRLTQQCEKCFKHLYTIREE